MKAVLLSGVFAIVVLTVAGAPTTTTTEGEQPLTMNEQQIEDFLRERRAPHHGHVVSSCEHFPTSSYIPNAELYDHGYLPHSIPHYGYPPHYRNVEDPEMMQFSDMDQFMPGQMPGHVPMARLGGYGVAAGVSPIAGIGGRVLGQAGAGTTLGVFPNANVGGCGVPLLFSCSPSIVSGQLVQSAPSHAVSAYTAPTNSYRLVDEPMQHHALEQHEQVTLTHEPSRRT
ncbi:uncharacterized protein LOC111352013 [Spodoptera litura]|uniref:Uncharacterized protein LOC111352013 n=1 Tax=Spodoptera litura TaxID=69820 RepID=A0A9J7E0Q7_SPOLT|nr:uncharacterized protein LOC111352013 [Spodoptera litura]